MPTMAHRGLDINPPCVMQAATLNKDYYSSHHTLVPTIASLVASLSVPCVMQAATLNKDYQTAVAIGSLQGKDMLLRITKRPGFELDDVLESGDDEKSESLWGRLTSWASKPNPLTEPALGAGEPLHHCPLTFFPSLFYLWLGSSRMVWFRYHVQRRRIFFSQTSYSHCLSFIVESVLHV